MCAAFPAEFWFFARIEIALVVGNTLRTNGLANEAPEQAVTGPLVSV
jgi:hypothetical protein